MERENAQKKIKETLNHLKHALVLESTPPKPAESDLKKLNKLLANEDHQGRVRMNAARRPQSFLQYTATFHQPIN
jgi:hypothetical protein